MASVPSSILGWRRLSVVETMNLALSYYAENPVIDRLVQWPPHAGKILRIRAATPVLRKPFIEIEYSNGKTEQHIFAKEQFARFWAEATVIINTLTDIEIISEVRYQPDVSAQELIADVMNSRREAIEESHEMFDAGMFRVFLQQYGENYKDLPVEVEQRIEIARRKTD